MSAFEAGAQPLPVALGVTPQQPLPVAVTAIKAVSDWEPVRTKAEPQPSKRFLARRAAARGRERPVSCETVKTARRQPVG